MSLRDQPARVVSAAALVAAVFFLAGCLGGGGNENKAGGKSGQTITLTMQTPDGQDPDAAFFIRQVEQRTAGRIRIVGGRDYPSISAANEARLVRDLRRGKVTMAYIAARDWESGGVTSFRALQAPFLITDYTLQRRVATGPIAQEMLHGLDRIGLVGLGLVPSELRRPLGRRPLLSAAAYRGARVRVMTSPTSLLDLRTLGATSVTNLTSVQVGPALLKGRLDGVETSTFFIDSNDYTRDARYLPSNLALFAKLQTIVIAAHVLDRLSAEERAALRAAAKATVRHADPAAGERAELQRLCRAGLRLVTATPSDLTSLRIATAPAYADLERDPFTKRAIAEIKRLKQSVPATYSTLPACRYGESPPGPAKTPFPEGTFVTTLTAADFDRGSVQHSNITLPSTSTTSFRDGRFRVVETASVPSGPPSGGRLVVHGDQVTFVSTYPPLAQGIRDVLRWSYFRGQLTLRVISVSDPGARLWYSAHPWRRVR